MKFISSKLLYKKKGFTVIELLLSITIAGIALMAISGATPIMMYQINFAKQKTVATYLAQEGIELIKNIRDYNTMSGLAWDATINGSIPEAQIDYTFVPGSTLTAYGAGNSLTLNGNGFYTYGGTAVSPAFKRKISLTKNTATTPNYLAVVSTVEWSDKYGNHQVVIQDNLYPYWAP